MTKGYKIVSLLESLIAVIIGALPLFLFGMSGFTLLIFVAVFVIAAANGVYQFKRVEWEREAEQGAQCPYKIEN